MTRIVRIVGFAVVLLLVGAAAFPYVQQIVAPGVGSSLKDWTCADQTKGVAASFCVTLPPPSPQDKVAWNIGQEVTAAKIGLIAQTKGITLETVPMTSGDLWVETKVDQSVRKLLADTLDSDLTRIAQDFGRPFTVRPKIITFATADSFELGMETLFEYPNNVARALARNNGGALVIPLRTIAINWHALGNEKPLTILRHELTHAMTREITGATATFPSWFDEGLATMEQASWAISDDDRYTAAAIVRAGTANLSQLSSADDWIRFSGTLSGRNYSMAAAAVDAMKDDIGVAGVSRILSELGRGAGFESAFTTATNKSLASFIRSFADTAIRKAPPRLVISDLPSGEVLWQLKGGLPSSNAVVTVDGTGDTHYRLQFNVMTDENGGYQSNFGATAPAGTYFVQVVSGDAEVSANAKTHK